MLQALFFIPALAAIAVLLVRWRRTPVRVLEEPAPAPPAATLSGEVEPIVTLDALLADLERTTVRIDGADELGEGAVAELELLAERLEAAAASLERVP